MPTQELQPFTSDTLIDADPATTAKSQNGCDCAKSADQDYHHAASLAHRASA